MSTSSQKLPELLGPLPIYKTLSIYTHASILSLHFSIEVTLPLNVTHIYGTFYLFLPLFSYFSTSLSLPSTYPKFSYLKNSWHINTGTQMFRQPHASLYRVFLFSYFLKVKQSLSLPLIFSAPLRSLLHVLSP